MSKQCNMHQQCRFPTTSMGAEFHLLRTKKAQMFQISCANGSFVLFGNKPDVVCERWEETHHWSPQITLSTERKSKWLIVFMIKKSPEKATTHPLWLPICSEFYTFPQRDQHDGKLFVRDDVMFSRTHFVPDIPVLISGTWGNEWMSDRRARLSLTSLQFFLQSSMQHGALTDWRCRAIWTMILSQEDS